MNTANWLSKAKRAPRRGDCHPGFTSALSSIPRWTGRRRCLGGGCWHERPVPSARPGSPPGKVWAPRRVPALTSRPGCAAVSRCHRNTGSSPPLPPPRPGAAAWPRSASPAPGVRARGAAGAAVPPLPLPPPPRTAFPAARTAAAGRDAAPSLLEPPGARPDRVPPSPRRRAAPPTASYRLRERWSRSPPPWRHRLNSAPLPGAAGPPVRAVPRAAAGRGRPGCPSAPAANAGQGRGARGGDGRGPPAPAPSARGPRGREASCGGVSPAGIAPHPTAIPRAGLASAMVPGGALPPPGVSPAFAPRVESERRRAQGVCESGGYQWGTAADAEDRQGDRPCRHQDVAECE